ncbi:MAG: Fe2+-dependent dioxygenase [Pseudomonadota bacterium]
MFITISDLLNRSALDRIADLIGGLEWRDGRKTAGRTARKVKRNEQADLSSPAGKTLSDLVQKAITDDPVLQAAARPRVFSNLLVSRMGIDGSYGPHVDNAIMRKGGAAIRTDLSFTIFLTPPDAYDGGELILHDAGVTQSIKAEAGDLVLYPSTFVHEVAPVTSGERFVCVGWIESLIADAQHRALLFDLENLRASLRTTLPGQSAELITLDKTIANLLRLWAKP